MPYNEDNKLHEIPLLPDAAREYLNPREEIAYKEHRRELIEWMYNLGKNPQKAEGYSLSTVKGRMKSLDLFYRYIWKQEERFVQTLTTEHADRWMRHLAKLKEWLDKNRGVAVALDEFDQLKHKTAVVYDLHLVNEDSENKLGLVMVSNQHPSQLNLDPRCQSRLNLQRSSVDWRNQEY